MYLSRLLLNPFNSRVRRDLGDCQRMHRTVMSGFPNGVKSGAGARSRYGVLYRIEATHRDQSIVLMVQSKVRPSWRHLADGGYLAPPVPEENNPAVKCINEQIARIAEGMVFRFRLKANPTRKVGTSSKADRLSGGPKSNGRRVFIEAPEEQVDWLTRKGAASGFKLLEVRVNPQIVDVVAGGDSVETGVKVTEDQKCEGGVAVTEHRLVFRGVVFDGHLRVTDEGMFKAALANGIGSGKAYGFGLMSLAPKDT